MPPHSLNRVRRSQWLFRCVFCGKVGSRALLAVRTEDLHSKSLFAVWTYHSTDTYPSTGKKSDHCPTCEIQEDLEHLFFQCKTYTAHRSAMNNEPSKARSAHLTIRYLLFPTCTRSACRATFDLISAFLHLTGPRDRLWQHRLVSLPNKSGFFGRLWGER